MKDKYEISLWEDYLVDASGTPGEPGYVPAHYEEKKICVIGSNTMTASYRAYAPELKSEINGTHTLTFKMYYTIKENQITVDSNTFAFDDWGNFIVNGHTSDEVRTPTYSTFDLKNTQNPFLNLLVNERKVKCYWKGEWYDFVIKGCREDSSGKSITYTCTDLFINELSKNGFNIVLDTELENNSGTITELGEYILDGTDWHLDTGNCDTIQQTKEEPVYECTTLRGWAEIEDQSIIPPSVQYTVQTEHDDLIIRKQPNTEADMVGHLSSGTSFTSDKVVVGEKVENVDTWVYYVSSNGNTKGYVSGAYLTPTPVIENKITIPENSKILVYYQQVQDVLKFFEDNSSETQLQTDIQFAYAPSYETDINSQLVTNAHCCHTNAYWYKQTVQGVDCLALVSADNPTIRIYYNAGVSNNYRGSRLVSQQICKLDTLTGKYCYVYTANDTTIPDGHPWHGKVQPGDEIYEYRTTEWNDALVVNNLVVNSKDFTSFTGWEGSNLNFQLYPLYSTTQSVGTYTGKSYLHFSGGSNYRNDIRQNRNFIPDGFSVGEKYIFRFKAYEDKMEGTVHVPDLNNQLTDGIYPAIQTVDSGRVTVYFTAERIEGVVDGWVEYRMLCRQSVSRADIYQKDVALYLGVSGSIDDCWIEEVQLFKEIYGHDSNDNTVRINPGDLDTQSISTIKYKYFNHTKTQGLLDPEDIEYLWSSSTDCAYKSYLDAEYNKDFEKIRSITAKQSNRFNLIQTLAQTFECWAQFIINHDSTGRTVYNSDGTPQKYVRFKKDVGQETGIGFVYGIDLKTISRTIQSDNIVTKTIVSPNTNEFATNGFCTISRSTENYPRTNFVLNFDYYINHGLLNGGVLNNDLYDSTSDIGYYYNLHRYNTEYDEITDFLDNKHLELTKQLSYQTVYDGTITSITDTINSIQANLMGLAGVTEWDKATKFITENADQTQVKEKMVALETQQSSLATYQTMKANIDASIAALQADIAAKEEQQEELVNLIKELDLKFYKKYSRFIQEGSWISEDYLDDNLYYLDAQSVAYTSSRPQISYDISVIRISNIEEFKNKVFHLGDIAFIQDTEFFGYTYVNQIKTPYKEKVLISEVISHFDEPEKDTFKVQNYKTQFEDLFQRITATTQSLQYTSGEYARAANIVESNGTINPQTLQSSIALNEQLVYSAQNESVVSDNTGLTVSDTTDPNNKTKITSGGVFITTDGGATWKNAIRGNGVSANALTAGSINTSVIQIMDGNFTAFRWDESGISAYDNLGELGINLSKFVRFDHYGIYGIENDGGKAYNPADENQIWNDAKFGMTWRGFFVKNQYGDHYVEVSSTDDIRVMKTPQNEDAIEVIKIGRIYHDPLDSSNDLYGIRIRDGAGNSVMETDDNGRLWLKNRLSISSTLGGYNIGIGYLDIPSGSGETLHRVIDANGEFIVYEDGSMKATAANIEGTITATSGYIGAIEITSTGLAVKNGGFVIYDTSTDPDTPVFYFDTTESKLKIKGDGEFTGAITATSGSFSGTISTNNITATGGTIGGFRIDENGIYSTDSEDNPSLSLVTDNNGVGTVNADFINLGTGAHINKFIRLGENALLWNPDYKEDPEDLDTIHNVIEITKTTTTTNGNDVETTIEDVVTLDDYGVLKLGKITMDGRISEISGDSFFITPSLASFNNVTVSGKISTAVFEQGHIQSVGGLMMFKPSYKIESRNNNILILNEKFNGAVGNYVYLIDEDGETVPGLISVTAINENTVTLDNINTDKDLVSLIDVGAVDSTTLEGEVIIGINSSDTASSFLKPRGITISQFTLGLVDPEHPTTSEKYINSNINPKVFIGDLDKSEINFADGSPEKRGFGLYSENVYLTGSLTTRLGDKFAGVNTLNSAIATVFGDTDNSRIVFWAGSAGLDTTSVQTAPFQVTQNGSLYAKQGIFKGSLIVDASIQGADIYTARIHGNGQDGTALSFYDTSKGIVFFRGEQNNASEVFSLGDTGLKKESDYFIEINALGIKFTGDNYYTKVTGQNSFIRLHENYIAGAHINNENVEALDTKITFNQKSQNIEQGMTFNVSDAEVMSIEQNTIKMNTYSVQMNNMVLFGDTLKYEKVSDGYNLYIITS